MQLHGTADLAVAGCCAPLPPLPDRSNGCQGLPSSPQQEYTGAKDTVIRYERELLRAFAFIVHAVHPHSFVITYVNALGGEKELTQLAWNVLNDR